MGGKDIGFNDFIASVIHDMKNSLNMQIDGLEQVASECRSEGKGSLCERLGPLIYEASRMDFNLVQLLSVYKMDNSIYPLDISEHQVRDVIDEAISRNRSMMALRGIQIEVDCAPEDYWYFDRDLVTGVLVNALNNAYKYTRDRIRVAGRIDGEFLEIRVEDNGSGYPATMLRDGISTKKRSNFTTGSTGLGFYFSSLVARMHANEGRHGELSIENGGAFGGSCFVVRLP